MFLMIPWNIQPWQRAIYEKAYQEALAVVATTRLETYQYAWNN